MFMLTKMSHAAYARFTVTSERHAYRMKEDWRIEKQQFRNILESLCYRNTSRPLHIRAKPGRFTIKTSEKKRDISYLRIQSSSLENLLASLLRCVSSSSADYLILTWTGCLQVEYVTDASIPSESIIRRCKLTRSPSCFCLITSRYLLLSRRLSLSFHLSMPPSLCNCMSVCLFLPVSFSPKFFFLSRSILPYLVVFLCLPVGFLIASSLFPHVLPSAPLFVSVHLCRYICRQCLLFLFFCH